MSAGWNTMQLRVDKSFTSFAKLLCFFAHTFAMWSLVLDSDNVVAVVVLT